MTRAQSTRKKVAGPDLEELTADWSIYITDLAEGTQRVYLRALRLLTDYLHAEEKSTLITDIDWIVLTGFLDSMRKRNGERVSEAYRSQVYRSLSVFFNWLADPWHGPGIIELSPLMKVRAPSQKPVPVPVISEPELDKLLSTCRGRDFQDRRDFAILRILIDTGVRAGEIAGLKVTDFNREQRLLTVTGKGNKKRDLRLERETYQALATYLLVRNRHRAADQPEMWLAVKGSSDGVLTQWGIRQIVERRVAEAGLTGRIYPHKFRHTYAHRWMADGGSEQELTYNAGWESNAMVNRYGKSAAAERARAAVDRVGLASKINGAGGTTSTGKRRKRR